MAAEADQQPATRMLETKKFTWKIENFSKLKETWLYSDPFVAGGRKWRILVYPKGEKSSEDCLSVYLDLPDWETYPEGWSVLADVSFTLVNQVNSTSSMQLRFSHSFHAEEDNWGFPNFIPIQDLHDVSKGLLDNDTLTIEAELSTEAATSDSEAAAVAVAGEPKVIQESLTLEPLSGQNHQVQAADNSATASKPISPSIVQTTSRKLIQQLSAMSLTGGSISCSNPDHGTSSLMQQQREKMVGFLAMSLEAISQTKSLDEVENTALQLAEQATNPVEKTVLKDLVSRLAEFKDVIPSSLSTIETSCGVESSVDQVKKDMEARLLHRKRQLSSLEIEVSRLGEEDMKLEAEIQQLSARKAVIVDQRRSTVAELDKANQEAAKELEELMKQCDESRQAVENRMRAKERLAQSNTSWKLFKDNLGW
ncbi:unnamed protein product [Linum trigynum]|uniref:MATH domain-containing protein n=1 Tax=Linum trigynum TaxID=586398 RepID=A0AAV2DAH9_9ROSI